MQPGNRQDMRRSRIRKAAPRLLGQALPLAQQQRLGQGAFFPENQAHPLRQRLAQAIEKGGRAPARAARQRQIPRAGRSRRNALLQKIHPKIKAVGVLPPRRKVHLALKGHRVPLPGQKRRLRIGGVRPVQPSLPANALLIFQNSPLQKAEGGSILPQRRIGR